MPGEVVRLFGPANVAPNSVHCMVTTRCQLTCPGCFYREREPAEWNMPLARKVMQEAHDLGVQWLAFGGGEPLLWEHLASVLFEAKEFGFKVAVTTNGIRTAAGSPGVLEGSIDRVAISHDIMHARGGDGNPGLWRSWPEREAWAGQSAQTWKDWGCPDVGLNTIADDIDVLSDDVLAAVDSVTFLLPKPLFPREHLALWLGEWKQKLATFRARFSGGIFVDSCLAVMLGQGPCLQGRTSMSIDVYGQARPCSNLKTPAMPGLDVKANPLPSVWASLACKDFQRPAGCLVGR